MSDEKVPFLDLVTVHRGLQDEFVDILKSALSTAGFIGGPMVQGFEQDFAQFCESRFCVGVGSGTDALRFALIAVGIRSGDIVVTVPNTFIATTEAISQAGARPDFVDIDERTYNMDPGKAPPVFGEGVLVGFGREAGLPQANGQSGDGSHSRASVWPDG